MSYLISFVTGKYAKLIWPMLGMLGLFMVYLYWNGRSNTIEDLTNDNAKLTADLILYKNQYELNINKLTNEINDQNLYIEKLKTDYDRLNDNLNHKIETANNNNNQLTSLLSGQLDLLYSSSTTTDLTCQQAIELVIKLANQHKWSTNK